MVPQQSQLIFSPIEFCPKYPYFVQKNIIIIDIIYTPHLHHRVMFPGSYRILGGGIQLNNNNNNAGRQKQ